MKRFLLLAAVAVMLAPNSSWGSGIESPEQCFESAAAKGMAALEVAGGVIRKADGSSYSLSLDFRPAFSGPVADGVEVWAEPSHTLLFVGAKSPLPQEESKKLGAEPLATVRGLSGAFSQKLTLPYDPAKGVTDRKIVVKMRVGNQDLLVASANVNVNAFWFTSTFDVIKTGAELYALGTYHHCCGGVRCSQICTDCDGPFFTCDLINCEISCDQPF